MPNDTDHKIRVVAEAFMGWKHGQMCDERNRDEYNYCRGCHTWGQGLEVHEIPPPNLLAPAGAWALLVALWNRGFLVKIGSLTGLSATGIGAQVLTGNDPTKALLDAAYQLATKEQR